jgi:glycosyltransferase involved in cell wall biosynthesis
MAYAESVYGKANKGVVIPAGADDEPFVDSAPQLNQSGSELSMLYCGNMGFMHDWNTIAQALNYLATSRVRLSAKFFGSGQGLSNLRESVKGNESNLSVEFGVGLDDEQWVYTMKKSSVALVTMRSGAERVVMPSKVYSSLMAGQAILAICSYNSDLADLVRKYDCGWVVEPGKSLELAELLENIAVEPQSVHRKRINAYSAGHQFFSAKVLAKQWLDLFRSLS